MSGENHYPVKLFDKMKKFIDKNGYVELAYGLKLTDTSGIKKWFREKHIPKSRANQVELFLKNKKLN